MIREDEDEDEDDPALPNGVTASGELHPDAVNTAAVATTRAVLRRAAWPGARGKTVEKVVIFLTEARCRGLSHTKTVNASPLHA